MFINLIGGGIKRWCCRTSVAYIESKSRTERPRKTKIGTEVAHATHNWDTTFKIKRSKVQVTGAGSYCGGLPPTACYLLISPNQMVYACTRGREGENFGHSRHRPLQWEDVVHRSRRCITVWNEVRLSQTQMTPYSQYTYNAATVSRVSHKDRRRRTVTHQQMLLLLLVLHGSDQWIHCVEAAQLEAWTHAPSPPAQLVRVQTSLPVHAYVLC